MDDIVIYSNSLEEHLKIVFQVLREINYTSRRRSAPAKEHFLGHIIGHGKVRMDPKKVMVIRDWEAPAKVSELRSFLGLVNYYHRFIEGIRGIYRCVGFRHLGSAYARRPPHSL